MTRPILDVPFAGWVSDFRLDVYDKAAYKKIVKKLRSMGYQVVCDMKGDAAAESGTTPYMYLTPDVARVKCLACGALSSINGCECHGKRCSGCDRVIYRDIYPGAVVSGTFDYDWRKVITGPLVWLKVVRWDEDEGYLYCAQELPEGLSTAQAYDTTASMNMYTDKWCTVVEDGKSLYKIRFTNQTDGDDAIYNVYADSEPEIGYTTVLYWYGIEYPEDSTDPALPDDVRIYKKW